MQLFSDDLIFIPNCVFYFICGLCNYAVSDADYFFLPLYNSPWWVRAFLSSRFRNHTQLDTTQLVRLLWTSDKTDAGTSTGQQHTQLTDERAGFKPAVPQSEQSQTDVLDRAATEIGTQTL